MYQNPRMPRTEAFLAEVMRFRGVAPLTVPHRAVQDTTIEVFIYYLLYINLSFIIN